MSRKKLIALLILLLVVSMGVLIAVIAFTGSAINKKQENRYHTEVVSGSVELATADMNLHKGMTRSRLTGQWVDDSTGNLVPYAVMYNNIYDAIPQSGISEADIVMESLVEGGITRLCCLFENKTSLEKIGPVRSCRTYFLLFAKEFEAIYVHFGYSDFAKPYLDNPQMHALDGETQCNFYRTADRIAPHNAYTSWSGITESAVNNGYSLVYPDNYISPFKFNTEDSSVIIPASDLKCDRIDLYYPHNMPWFEYNKDDCKYYRYQFDEPHIDEQTGQQLAFDNIIVKYVEPEYFDNGTPDYKVDGTGTGYFISNGLAAPIIWKKGKELSGPTRYYYTDGKEITLNTGKTYIALVQTDTGISITGEE